MLRAEGLCVRDGNTHAQHTVPLRTATRTLLATASVIQLTTLGARADGADTATVAARMRRADLDLDKLVRRGVRDGLDDVAS